MQRKQYKGSRVFLLARRLLRSWLVQPDLRSQPMAQMNASSDPSMPPCRYWASGRTCWAASGWMGCKNYHDPAYVSKNICHRWQRYDCKHGWRCNFLHRGPGAARPGYDAGHVDISPNLIDPPPSTHNIETESASAIVKHVMAMVKLQMKRDREEIPDEEARSKKFKHIYQKCFHPDKMGQVDTLNASATEITKAIMNEKEWYLKT